MTIVRRLFATARESHGTLIGSVPDVGKETATVGREGYSVRAHAGVP
jgi:hypothetical protein